MTEANRGRLLVVDDEAELMQVLRETLTGQGYDVAGVTSGADAVAALRAGPFDLVLTNLMMPGMDGLQLLRTALDTDPDLVVVLMTGQGTIQTAVEALKTGAFDYLLKPFKLHALLPVLTRGLEVRRLRAENLKLRESAAIHDFARAVAGSLDARAVLARLVQGVLRHLPADGVAVFLPSADGRRLEAVVAHGPAAEPLLRRGVSLEPVRAAWADRHWEPINGFTALGVPDLAALPEPAGGTVELFPLLAGGKFGGALALSRAAGRGSWAEGTRTAVSILASTAATALANAALVADVRRAERRYRGIFEQSVEGIFQVRPDGSFLTANPALARMLGYDAPEPLLAGPAAESVAHRAGWQRLLDRADRGERAEAEVERRDGGTVWVAGTLRRGTGPDGPFVEGRLEDVTERKRLEANLLRAQRMEVVGSLEPVMNRSAL
ncbi:MAG TPA: response regulator [Gemmataceae bacterium]